tara:strand:+ start:16 stop:417 length:402 start_codon:yes stop_codon:yes gene_type:complete
MPVTDVTPPDYSTAIGQVRLLIPDVEQLDNPADATASAEYLFNDSQIQAFVTMYASSIKRAAAQAKLVLATSEALINKVISTYDLKTDGAKLGAELREQAKQLREEAIEDEQEDANDTFTVVGNTTSWTNSWL